MTLEMRGSLRKFIQNITSIVVIGLIEAFSDFIFEEWKDFLMGIKKNPPSVLKAAQTPATVDFPHGEMRNNNKISKNLIHYYLIGINN